MLGPPEPSPPVAALDPWWQRIYAHVFSDPGNEVGGVLLGTHLSGAVTRISAVVEARDARGDYTSLTFTHESWSHIHAVKDRDFPSDTIVGWYHSHPGHGVFLSGHDRFIHEHFFPAPFQIAVVVDPQQRREGVFGWSGDGLQVLVARPCVGAPPTPPFEPPRRLTEVPPPPPPRLDVVVAPEEP